MRIGELASKADIASSTIRYYESLGLLPKPKRSDAGYRIYDENSLAMLQMIKLGQSLGFTLEELPKLLSPDVDIDHQLVMQKLNSKQEELSSMISQLQTKQRQLTQLQSTLKDYWENGTCLPQETLLALMNQKNY